MKESRNYLNSARQQVAFKRDNELLKGYIYIIKVPADLYILKDRSKLAKLSELYGRFKCGDKLLRVVFAINNRTHCTLKPISE